MDEKKINIDEFLRSINSELPVDEDYLDFFMSREPKEKMPEHHVEKLSSDLRESQEKRHRLNQRMSFPEKLVSLGEYLQLLKEKLDLERKGKALASFLGVESDLIPKLETNTVSIVSIPLRELYSMGRSIGLNTGTYLELLRKSHRLHNIGPRYKGAARYDSREGTKGKEQSMKIAYEELLLKGKAEERDNDLESHLHALREMLEKS